jgi:hypothetical protein
LAAFPRKELMGDLEENAGTIAGLGIASARPAVREVEQYLDSLTYNFVALVSANVGDESDSARVVFLRRMVQALSGRRSIRFVLTRHHSVVGIVTSAAYGGWNTNPQISTFRQMRGEVQSRISIGRMQKMLRMQK